MNQKPRNFVVMFQDIFVSRVQSGTKRHTIRKLRKGERQIQAGDGLSLRYWSGRAYSSKTVLMHDVVCVRVSPIILTDGPISFDLDGKMSCLSGDPHVLVNNVRLDSDQSDNLANADGFENLALMLDWHRENNGLPVDGRLIEWPDPTSRVVC